MNKLTKENFGSILREWMIKNNLNITQIAEVLECSRFTIDRLQRKVTLPTSEMIKQTGLLIEIGYERYSRLSKSEKEKFSETIGTVSGAGLGFASITAVVSTLGTAGLSGAGIMSGLAAAGAYVGGGAAAGIATVALVPVATAVVGYSVIKGVKRVAKNYKTNIKEVNFKWEMSE